MLAVVSVSCDVFACLFFYPMYTSYVSYARICRDLTHVRMQDEYD